MCTQSSLIPPTVIPRAITPEGIIPTAYLSDFLPASNPVNSSVASVATTALTTTSSTSTTEFSAAINAKTTASVDHVAQKIEGLKFLADAMEAVSKGKSLESFMNREFDAEDKPHVNVHHLSIAIREFSIEGMQFLSKFKWDPPYFCPEIIIENLLDDLKEKNHLRIIKYLPFILELIKKMNWNSNIFHVYYLIYLRYDCQSYCYTTGTEQKVWYAEHLPLLTEIQKTYKLDASSILARLTQIWQLENALQSPFLKRFEIDEKDVKKRIADLKAEEKKVKK